MQGKRNWRRKKKNMTCGVMGKMDDDQKAMWELAQRICDAEVAQGIVKYCPYCGTRLKEGSLNYFEGFHVDGCD